MRPILISAMAALAASCIAVASGAMPASQQNALVQKYCAVCHTDAARNGGLSLQHFDAARADPADAAMMVSKLKTGAIGAAGVPPPDQATIDRWISAMSIEAVGANEWTVNRTQDPTTKAPILTASIVQGVPSTAKEAVVPDLYRLTVTCRIDTREGEMQLAWSPATPKPGQELSAAIDGRGLFTYKIEGSEKMGNGANGSSGPGSAILYATTRNSTAPEHVMPLPGQTLTISHLFPDETVEFPFSHLNQSLRQSLSTCFTGSSTSQ